ncbi:MAG: hypothetical protein FWD55_06980 [Propionibacteriaceae bacterium]|nr:hypothetical protein [Propionibacteriaceae bacterium]
MYYYRLGASHRALLALGGSLALRTLPEGGGPGFGHGLRVYSQVRGECEEAPQEFDVRTRDRLACGFFVIGVAQVRVSCTRAPQPALVRTGARKREAGV